MPMSNGTNSPGLIGVVEAGTRTCRFVAFSSQTLQEIDQHELDVTTMRPQEGWVEQDPMEILRATNTCIAEVMRRLQESHGHVATLGITNQRETTVVWDRLTGKPLFNALVWNDIRTSSTVDRLLARFPDRNQNYLKSRCGLPVSPYFSGVKLRWLMDNVPAVSLAIAEGRCLFGTVDTWLVWNLTGGVDGGLHITDVTNASRTLLMNIDTLKWDPDLCAALDVPQNILPEIRTCSEIVGRVKVGPLSGTLISGIMGNQQAALVGERCFLEGQSKNTYRSGGFLLYNTGEKRIHSTHGLLSTVAYQMGPDAPPVYALEGSVAVAGHAINWLKQNMKLLDNPADSERLAAEVPSTGDVYFVPAFTGLYAPYWRKDARGILCGLTQFTTKAHIIRAALEAVCFQTRDILEAMAKDSINAPLKELRVNGKMAVNNLLLQLQADVCGVPVVRSDVHDKPALGVALAAGQASGVHLVTLNQQVIPSPHVDVFKPMSDDGERRARYQKWKMAVSRSLGWATASKSTAMTDSRYHMLASIPAGLFLITSFGFLALSQFPQRP